MKKVIVVLFVAFCASCAVHYFPVEPSTSVERIDPQHRRLGFAVTPPVGWKETRRYVFKGSRMIVFRNENIESNIDVTMILSNRSMEDELEYDRALEHSVGWKVTEVSSAGAAGKYFLGSSSNNRRFVGARFYEPCGKHARCVVKLTAHWSKADESAAHSAISQVIQSFRFTR